MYKQASPPPSTFAHHAVQRAIVVGIAGSGKTTFAQHLAVAFGLCHAELDALYWDAQWMPAPTEVFRERVRFRLQSASRWVIDGNYSRTRDLTWPLANTILWLDYSLPRILWQLWWRTWQRIGMRQVLWNGNRETFHSQFLDRNSLFRYVIHNYRRKQVIYHSLFADPTYAHAQRLRFTRPATAALWLHEQSQESNKA